MSRLLQVIAFVTKLMVPCAHWTNSSDPVAHDSSSLFELEGLKIILHGFCDDSFSWLIM